MLGHATDTDVPTAIKSDQGRTNMIVDYAEVPVEPERLVLVLYQPQWPRCTDLSGA